MPLVDANFQVVTWVKKCKLNPSLALLQNGQNPKGTPFGFWPKWWFLTEIPISWSFQTISPIWVRDGRGIRFFGKRETTSVSKWHSSRGLYSREHTHKKYSQRMESARDYAHKRAFRCPGYSPRRNKGCTHRGTQRGYPRALARGRGTWINGVWGTKKGIGRREPYFANSW